MIKNKLFIIFHLLALGIFLITTPATAEKTDSYQLLPGDFLRIVVFGVEDLTGEYRIDTRGNITLPLIGEITAEGFEAPALQNIIAQKLVQEGYFNTPKVTVEIIALQPFYILGEVNSPGRYDYYPDLDIFKAVAIAGGYTPRASKGSIIIYRTINGKKTEIEADEQTIILPGDSIKIKQRLF